MVPMNSSTNGDIVQVVIQKPNSLFPNLITTPPSTPPTPNKNITHTMNTILVPKNPSDMQAQNTQFFHQLDLQNTRNNVGRWR